MGTRFLILILSMTMSQYVLSADNARETKTNAEVKNDRIIREITDEKKKLDEHLSLARSITHGATASPRLSDESLLYRIDCSPASEVKPQAVELHEQWRAFRSQCYRYLTDALKHRSNSIEWQQFSTRVIFWTVLTLVALGMYFSWVQFRSAMKFAKRGVPEGLGGEAEIQVSGLKVSSPVLGVIILALSLGFFYLYLAFVYPIREIT
jgi:hypothetical protein